MPPRLVPVARPRKPGNPFDVGDLLRGVLLGGVLVLAVFAVGMLASLLIGGLLEAAGVASGPRGGIVVGAVAVIALAGFGGTFLHFVRSDRRWVAVGVGLVFSGLVLAVVAATFESVRWNRRAATWRARRAAMPTGPLAPGAGSPNTPR